LAKLTSAEGVIKAREAKRDLLGVAIYDGLDQQLPSDPNLAQLMWRRCELENDLCRREVLHAYAADQAARRLGALFAQTWRDQMETCIDPEISEKLDTLVEVARRAWPRESR
jgi:hypothetical protein